MTLFYIIWCFTGLKVDITCFSKVRIICHNTKLATIYCIIINLQFHIIDASYPFVNSLSDTVDKLKPESLEQIGRTLEVWLERGADFPN